ncbi:hypothetical protein [Glycomyces paridis]|uniref:hypothetical protein n=1 Tax=Glycomyces paridis TaxID=2126555 RepID=UPI0013050F7E|nr:hypothetical protein [Glycomyces paridis]
MTGARPQAGGPRTTDRPCRRCREPRPDCECTATELGNAVRWSELRALLVADYLRAHRALNGANALERRAAAADKASAADALARLLVAAGEAPDFAAAAAAVAHGRLPELENLPE